MSLADHRRAQDGFAAVLAAVPTGGWDRPSACVDWTVRDVAGHTVWGQELVRHVAEGLLYSSREGAPGSAHPGSLADRDPLGRWRAARDATAVALTEEALRRPGPPRFVAARPGATLEDFLLVLTVDYLAHTWDVGRPCRLVPDLVARTLPYARTVPRGPGMFDAALTPPDDADDQTRWLAALGRSHRAVGVIPAA